jgi:hypothetical protein
VVRRQLDLIDALALPDTVLEFAIHPRRIPTGEDNPAQQQPADGAPGVEGDRASLFPSIPNGLPAIQGRTPLPRKRVSPPAPGSPRPLITAPEQQAAHCGPPSHHLSQPALGDLSRRRGLN